jgi:CHASE2 domain-containing sensor protein
MKKKRSFTAFLDKYFVLKESLMATLMTIIITFAVSFIPIKFEFSKAIRQEFLGFDIYDLYYTGKHLKNTQRDTNIVIVEIGKDRATIADQVNLLQKYSPAVIGLDVVFDKEAQDPLENIRLLQAITQHNNIVFASRLEIDSTSKKAGFVTNFFDEKDRHFPAGYINFIGNQFSVLRNYPPFYKINDSVYSSFTSVIIKKFSAEKFRKLQKRNKKSEIINYTGNLENFTTLSAEQLLAGDSTGQLGSLLTGKIVLVGYFVKPGVPLVIEDLHFSPLNVQLSGKSNPDMYGVVIHANILSMILNENYAGQASDFLSYLIAAFLIFLFLFYMLSEYKKKQHPKHGKFLLIQFLLILLMMYVFVQVFNLFLVKVPLLPIMIALVLCVELLGVYKNIALWLHKKYHYKTVFAHKHII